MRLLLTLSSLAVFFAIALYGPEAIDRAFKYLGIPWKGEFGTFFLVLMCALLTVAFCLLIALGCYIEDCLFPPGPLTRGGLPYLKPKEEFLDRMRLVIVFMVAAWMCIMTWRGLRFCGVQEVSGLIILLYVVLFPLYSVVSALMIDALVSRTKSRRRE